MNEDTKSKFDTLVVSSNKAKSAKREQTPLSQVGAFMNTINNAVTITRTRGILDAARGATKGSGFIHIPLFAVEIGNEDKATEIAKNFKKHIRTLDDAILTVQIDGETVNCTGGWGAVLFNGKELEVLDAIKELGEVLKEEYNSTY